MSNPTPEPIELRDQIAIAVLNGFLSQDLGDCQPWPIGDFPDIQRALAETAYRYADAMMEARSR